MSRILPQMLNKLKKLKNMYTFITQFIEYYVIVYYYY